MNMDSIINSIWTMNDNEVNQVVRAVRGRRDQLVRMKTYSFGLGDKVYFKHKGNNKYGTITKVNQKTCKVRTEDGRHWTVTSTLLMRQ